MSKISVCLATYNGELFVENQIRSILIQLNIDDEIIISDDCSTDNTLSIIKSIEDNRICILPPRKFRSAIRNFEYALSRASGDVIFLSDQDDVWLPGKVKKVLNGLDQADLVLTDCVVMDNSDLVIHESFFRHRSSKPGLWTNLWRNSYMGCCMAFRKDILSYSMPFPKNIHMHDWWLGLMVEKKGKVLFLDEPLLKYIRHGNNVSPTGEGQYSWSKRIANRFWMAWYILVRSFL